MATPATFKNLSALSVISAADDGYLYLIDNAGAVEGRVLVSDLLSLASTVITWDFTSASTSAAAGDHHVLSGAGTVLTFPTGAPDGSQIITMRNDAANVPNVIRGGADTINDETGNVSLDTDTGTTVWIYDQSNTNWIISNRFTS